MNIKTTESGVKLIKELEGLRLEAYDDGGGVKTIGWGHAIKPGEDIPDIITEEEAEILLIEDIKDAEEIIDETVSVPLLPNQYDALVSFVFNIGGGAFRKSTLLQLLNAHLYDEVPKQMARWIYDNKKRIYGLEVRRSKEAERFKNEYDEVV